MTLSPPDLRINRERAPEAEETVLLDWRRRRNRRRLVLRVVVPLLVLALIAGGIYLVGFSSVFAVKSVRIGGEQQLTAADISRTAAVPIGAPLARTDIGAIRRRVAGIREVESATVRRSWPNTVTITVVERKPLYAVADGSSYLLVDRFGVGFRTAATSGSLPRATVGGTVGANDQKLLRSVGVVVGALPSSLRHKVDRIEAKTQDSITLRLSNGDQVFWGSADQSELKAQVVVPLLKQQGSRYDVSAPGSPAIR